MGNSEIVLRRQVDKKKNIECIDRKQKMKKAYPVIF